MTSTATGQLTRAEAAYAHLASFQRGDDVIVTDPGGRRSGAVTSPQRGDVAGAYLTVRLDGSGGDIWVTAAGLLSGEQRIATDADDRAGNVRYFDEAGYAAQNG